MILGLILSYLSVYINPEKNWLFAFFGLAYPFLLIANIVFIAFWIVKRKRFFVVPLLFVLLGWTYISSWVQISLKKDTNEKPEQSIVNILSYNVRLFDIYDWNKDKNTSKKIFDFINTEKPNVICFQEFNTRSKKGITEERISKLLKGKYYSHINYSDSKTKAGYGIATYSTYPIIKRQVITFPNSSSSCVCTDIRFNNDTVRIFNCHLQSIKFKANNYSFISNSKILEEDERMREIKDISYRLRDAFKKRAKQAQILARVIKKSPYKVIVCGDFNDVPFSYTYHTIKKGLNDSFIEAGAGFGNTYLGKFPSFRIDYILHSDDVVCFDYTKHKVELSDHFPISAKFYLE